MEEYGFSSYDAVHAATGIVLGSVEAIVTLDTGVAALPESITIFTAQPSVRAMRRYRGGQATT